MYFIIENPFIFTLSPIYHFFKRLMFGFYLFTLDLF